MTAYDPSSKESRLETYKVYTHVFDKEGKEPITKGAGGDYTHHRGIFLGWSKTKFDGKGIDSWHMKGCVQVYQKILAEETGEHSAKLTVLIHWQTDDGKFSWRRNGPRCSPVSRAMVPTSKSMCIQN